MTTTNNLETEAPGITLSDTVEQFMIASFNDKRTYFPNYLFNAKIVWRELFWTTLFRVKEVLLPVYKDKDGYYIIKPKDLIRLLAISAKDKEGVHHPLLLSADVPTEILHTPDTNPCEKCGQINLCNVLDSKIVTRTERVNDTDYILKTYYKTLADGTISEVEEYPVFDQPTSTVTIQKRDKFACKVEKSECGCIRATPENLKALAVHCGCGTIHNDRHLVTNKYGYFNHKFEGNTVRLELGEAITRSGLPMNLIVSYQTNAESGMEEAIVPVYAVNAMIAGTAYYSSLYRTSISERDKDALRKNYNRTKEALLLFMFPFDLNAFAELQGIIPKW